MINLRLSRAQRLVLYLFLSILIPFQVAHAESACENPIFPACEASSSRQALKIAIMVDASGSIKEHQKAKIRQATLAYGTELAEKTTERNQVEFSVYTFASQVRPVINAIDVKSSSFRNTLNTLQYLPFEGGSTLFSAALQHLQSMPERQRPNLVLFLTDGFILSHDRIQSKACSLKAQGTYLFAVILSSGSSPPRSRIRELTGSRELKRNASQIEQADWMFETYNGLNNCMIELASAAVDQISPEITCPASKKVTTSMHPSRTGKATATDNCDSQIEITHEDAVDEGDCNWECKINRTWTATDQRGNSTSCIQVLEKSASKTIEEALEKGPLVLGFTSTTLTIEQKDAKCLSKWMPYQGTRTSGLKRGNQKVSTSCRPGSNAVNSSGKITNPLLGEALHLALYLRVEPEFGARSLSSLSLSIPAIVRQNLARNPDVNDLMETTNKTLGNLILVPHKKELLKVLKEINEDLKFD